MSTLIDSIDKSTTCLIGERWYVAKPLCYTSIQTYIWRIKDAIRVLLGKSIAVHYKEDEQ